MQRRRAQDEDERVLLLGNIAHPLSEGAIFFYKKKLCHPRCAIFPSKGIGQERKAAVSASNSIQDPRSGPSPPQKIPKCSNGIR
jgi:hypothetical protein